MCPAGIWRSDTTCSFPFKGPSVGLVDFPAEQILTIQHDHKLQGQGLGLPGTRVEAKGGAVNMLVGVFALFSCCNKSSQR